MPRTNIAHPDAVLTRLLTENKIVRIVVNCTRSGVVVPPELRQGQHESLDIGLNMAVPIPDLHVNKQWIKCTLSFGGRQVFCILPWTAVLGMIGLDTQECVVLETLPGIPPPLPPPPARGATVIDLMARRTPADRAAVCRRFAAMGKYI